MSLTPSEHQQEQRRLFEAVNAQLSRRIRQSFLFFLLNTPDHEITIRELIESLSYGENLPSDQDEFGTIV